MTTPTRLIEEARKIVGEIEAMPSDGNVAIITAALLAAEQRGREMERERCAKICDTVEGCANEARKSGGVLEDAINASLATSCRVLAQVIRSRSEEPKP